MFLKRIYCRRTRDGRLFRFNSMRLLRAYSRENNETARTLPIIDRTEFIKWKNKLAKPVWVHSTMYVGMALLTEGAR